jgi:hypothetical protein
VELVILFLVREPAVQVNEDPEGNVFVRIQIPDESEAILL